MAVDVCPVLVRGVGSSCMWRDVLCGGSMVCEQEAGLQWSHLSREWFSSAGQEISSAPTHAGSPQSGELVHSEHFYTSKKQLSTGVKKENTTFYYYFILFYLVWRDLNFLFIFKCYFECILYFVHHYCIYYIILCYMIVATEFEKRSGQA